MSLAQVLAAFKADVGQCDALIANAHGINAVGASILPLLDRKQVTVAAFLNFYISWETFIESSLAELMVGGATISGSLPVRYVSPVNVEAARAMLIGVHRYFDYGNHDYVKRMAGMYFQNGYPYEPHLSAISSDLADLRTIRNASAHITSSTQTALEGLALRIFSTPKPNIDLYSLLTANDPRSSGGATVFSSYKEKILITAELIVNG